MKFIITDYFQGTPVQFRFPDGYVNATAICAIYGKRVHEFLCLTRTQRFIAQLTKDAAKRERDEMEYPVFLTKGKNEGTWLYPTLGISCATWLSDECGKWCNHAVSRIILSTMEPKPSLPQTYIEALKALTLEVEAKEKLALTNSQLSTAIDKALYVLRS